MANRARAKATTTSTTIPPASTTGLKQPPPPPSPASTSTHDHVRHYPLDLPSGLPFERYEHRRISTRDILVRRILSKLLRPSTRELAESLDEHRPSAYQISQRHSLSTHLLCDRDGLIEDTMTLRRRHHNFGPVKRHDQTLARDIEVLRKTLVTSLTSEWGVDPYLISGMGKYRHMAPVTSDLSVQQEVLELVRIYFMETDDAATRLWLNSIQTAHRATYDTLSRLPAKKSSSKALLQERKEWEYHHAQHQGKNWYQDDQVHLQRLRQAMALPRLYDGGAFMTGLRRPLWESRSPRLLYMSAPYERNPFMLSESFAEKKGLYPWPEAAKAPHRFLHIPSYCYRTFLRHGFENPHRVEFSTARVGRGLDRDGIWSTAGGDDLDRGRTRQRGQRRRATSEPPPGLFMASQLPTSYLLARELVVFPKMSLAAIEHRVRSRSLSRTRIAEMFNWDVIVEEPHTGNNDNNGTTLAQSKSNNASKFTTPKRTTFLLEVLDLVLDDFENQFYRINMYLKSRLRGVWETLAAHVGDDFKNWWDCWSKWLLDDGDPVLCMHIYSTYEHVLETQAAKEELKTGCACENCKSTSHATSRCVLACGFCGAANPSMLPPVHPFTFPGSGNPHLAPNCPVAKQNRCKCVPFPQYHVAAKCAIVCSRDCGNGTSPGHFQHKSAMTCTSRCCMCGMRGHSGMKCKLKRCRCGGSHLGQDCRFHPECRVPGCDRFLCGVHCQSCGLDRAQLGEGLVLVGQKCPACRPVDGSADGEKKTRRNRRKHRPVGRKEEEEKRPWYAPLEPRTRPVVLGKSGKKTSAKYHKNGSDYLSCQGGK